MDNNECTCISCPECNGTGSVWRAFDGTYLGDSRCDDLDELETCEECCGSGLAEMCDACRSYEEDDDE